MAEGDEEGRVRRVSEDEEEPDRLDLPAVRTLGLYLEAVQEDFGGRGGEELLREFALFREAFLILLFIEDVTLGMVVLLRSGQPEAVHLEARAVRVGVAA